MSAANYDLVIDQGSTFAIDLVIKESGSTKDLRSTKTSSSIAGTFTCTVLSPVSDGKVKIELPASTSSAMEAGMYFYDLEIHTGSDAIVKRLLEGKVTLNQEVTR